MLSLTHDYNYKDVGDFLGVDLVNNPERVADPNTDLAWKAAIAYWARISKLLCLGNYDPMTGFQTCPDAARAGNFAITTRRLNYWQECYAYPESTKAGRDKQNLRVARLGEVRAIMRLPQITDSAKLYC
jgi:hypothetical protein